MQQSGSHFTKRRTWMIIGVALQLSYHWAFCQADTAGLDSQASKWTYRASGNIFKLHSDDKVLFKQKPSTSLETTETEKSPDKFYSTPFQSVQPNTFRGKRVEYSAYLKSENVEGIAGLWMKAKNGDKVVAFDNMDSHAIKGTSDWKKYSIAFDIPADIDELNIGFYLTGGGKLWIAEPNLAAASKNVRAVSKVWNEKKYWQFASELKKEPVNMDFSASTTGGGIQDWMVFTSPSPSKVGVDQNAVYQNKPSGFIEQEEKNPGDFVLFFQDISAAKYLGKRVNLSGFVKTQSVTDWTALWMRVDAGKSVLAFDNMQDRPIHGNTEWTKNSIELNVPPGATRIRLGFMQAGSGKSWLNHAKLDIVGQALPQTSSSPPQPSAENKGK